MAEKRRARRYELNIDILELNGKPVQGARILDLSTNGAKLELTYSPRINEQLIFKFILPGFQRQNKISGRVAWKKTILEGRYIIGIQFFNNFWDIDQWFRNQIFKST